MPHHALLMARGALAWAVEHLPASRATQYLVRVLAIRVPSGQDAASRSPPGTLGQLVLDLAPRPEAAARPSMRSGVYLRRLGLKLERIGRRGIGKAPAELCGIEAVRGTCVSGAANLHLDLGLDGVPLRSVALTSVPAGRRRKHVFNVWLDTSRLPLGRHTLSLVFREGRWVRHVRRVAVLVRPPLQPMRPVASDSYVPVPLEDPGPEGLEAVIDARPSIVRQARRAVLEPPRSVLVVRADQLGDLVCSIPAILRLRQLFPGAHLTGLVTATGADLARSLGVFDDMAVADFPASEAEGRRTMTLAEQRRLIDLFEPRRFDLAVDLSENPQTRPLLLLSGAGQLAGFQGREFPWLTLGFDGGARDDFNGLERASHTAKMVGLVEWLGVLAGAHALTLPRAVGPVPEAERAVVLHTGARLAFSRWPGFVALAELLLGQTEWPIVMIVDKGERPQLPDGLQASDRFRLVEGPLPFEAFDVLLASCRLFVGNDSGPKHLASLRGAPVVSLHMARHNWEEWGQSSSGVVISRRVPCAGCGIYDRPEECGRDYACLTRIRPGEVFEAAMALVGSDGPLLQGTRDQGGTEAPGLTRAAAATGGP